MSLPAFPPHRALAEEADAAPKSYQPVQVTLPEPNKDADFATFRRQLATIADKRDRNALRGLVAPGFFWMLENKDTADKKKAPIETLLRALAIVALEGWDILADLADDDTADPYSERPGVICAPGFPKYDQTAADAVEDATQTDPSDWGYTTRDGIEVRESAARDAPVIEKLGLQLVWMYPDESATENDETIRIVAPSGKVGYVMADDLRELPAAQLCYVKTGNAWKIAGVVGSFGENN
jgi:hypothetical protein